LFVSKLQ
jgi:hypothetical protein